MCLYCRYEQPGASVMSAFGKGIHKFFNLPDSILYLSLQDPANPPPSTYNGVKYVSIWRPSGRIKVITIVLNYSLFYNKIKCIIIFSGHFINR